MDSSFLSKLFGWMRPTEYGTGANVDVRPQEEKDKDYVFAEVVASANPVNWREKSQAEWRSFPIYNQNGSGSCVAQTAAKLLGIILYLQENTYIHFSATHIYQRRSNKPNGGMGGVDVFNILRKGSTLEVLAPSQSKTDAQMDSLRIEPYKQRVGDVFKIGNFVMLPSGDLETVASVIETTKKGVMVWFYFTRDEWTTDPKILDTSLTASSPRALRHSVTAVDFSLVNGKKCLIIEDSWGPNHGIGGRRVITEEFFKKRNFFAAYATSFAFNDPGLAPTPINPPADKFKKELSFIPWSIEKNAPSDEVLHAAQKSDVVMLQDTLKVQGFFPKDRDSTGYYGSLTAKAVLGFQKKYAVAPIAELDALAGTKVGVKTLEKLNSL